MGAPMVLVFEPWVSHGCPEAVWAVWAVGGRRPVRRPSGAKLDLFRGAASSGGQNKSSLAPGGRPEVMRGLTFGFTHSDRGGKRPYFEVHP